jgi:hypothetical protein
LPMDQLVDVVQAPRDPTRMPLAQVNFRLQSGKPPDLKLSGMTLEPIPLIDTFISKFDMALEVASDPSEAGYLEYNSDLFSETRMRCIPGAYESLLRTLLANPDAPANESLVYAEVGKLSPKRRRLALGGLQSRPEGAVHA